jgi:hypothetical protein
VVIAVDGTVLAFPRADDGCWIAAASGSAT